MKWRKETRDVVYLRGSSAAPFLLCLSRRASEPRFVGFGLEVESRADLTRLNTIAGASSIEPLTTPGGGEVVRLRDPSGFVVEAVCGQASLSAAPTPQPLTHNTMDAQPRVNSGLRPVVAPPAVRKLGHVVLEASDFQATCAWYTEHFGLIPSDVQVLPDGSPVVAFLRFDRGDTPTDHHSIAIGQGLTPCFNHAAYEVADLDAIGMGQRVLREQDYEHAWGIGRHLLGSQIFDYWNDPWGEKHEHYCDGDVFTAEVPTGVSAASSEGLYQWGPPLPASFLKPKLNLATIAAALRNLSRSPDLSFRKLGMMARLAKEVAG